MAQQKSAKGNPASHRMSNPKRKDRCVTAHTRRTKAAQRHRDAQNTRERANQLSTDPKPWALAQAVRKERRAHDPAVIKRRRMFA